MEKIGQIFAFILIIAGVVFWLFMIFKSLEESNENKM